MTIPYQHLRRHDKEGRALLPLPKKWDDFCICKCHKMYGVSNNQMGSSCYRLQVCIYCAPTELYPNLRPND